VVLGSPEGEPYIECGLPAGVEPFRIEWRENATRELDRVLVFGYQPFAGHRVGLLHARGEINAKVAPLGEEWRVSLMISNIAASGCSGGPVVSESGNIVGVISRGNIFERGENDRRIDFVSAVLSCYLQEFAV
jgi:hypothetical protein